MLVIRMGVIKGVLISCSFCVGVILIVFVVWMIVGLMFCNLVMLLCRIGSSVYSVSVISDGRKLSVGMLLLMRVERLSSSG